MRLAGLPKIAKLPSINPIGWIVSTVIPRQPKITAPTAGSPRN